MSRTIFEKRQLTPYRVRWTVSAALRLTFVVAIVLGVLIGSVVLIATSDAPLVYTILGGLFLLMLYLASRMTHPRDDWTTAFLVGFIFGHNNSHD